MNRLAPALLLAALLPAGVHAQPATLVRDINSHPPAAGSPGASPRQFAAAGGRAVFIVREEAGEGEPATPSYLLWASDGSAAGTSMLARLCSPCGVEPQRTAELPGFAFYQVEDVDTGMFRLWRTDGTRAGTFPITPPLPTSYPMPVAVLGRRLLFEACADGSPCSLWSTDGSATVAVPLHGSIPAGDLVVAGDHVFFRGTNEQGTRFLRKFAEPNHYQSSITNFLEPVPGGGIVLVGVSGGSDGINLWRSDGTPAGTRQLTAFPDLVSLRGLQENQIAAAGDRTFFIVTNVTGPRLWSTQGSPATTVPVTGCPGGCPALRPDSPLAPAGDRIVFAARDLAYGTEPWTSDGTGAGTRLLRDLCLGACDSDPDAFTAHGGWIDFRAIWNGRTRLVRTDGISAVALAPLPPAAGGDSPRIDLTDLGSRTFFVGFDAQGLQPWVTDGTPAGSRRIVSGANSGGSDPRDSVVLGDRILFTASDGAGRSVWSITSQGEAAPLPGTGVPVDRPGPSDLTVSGGVAYFVADRGPDGAELWRTDGSPAGTIRLASFQNRALSELRDAGGQLLFLVISTDGEQPVFSFWGSDGTPAGTARRFDLPPDTVGVTDVTALGPELYFLLHGETASQIFHSDGTADGTRMILQQSCDCAIVDSEVRFLRSGARVYFTAWTDSGLDLFQTDGTAAGTTQVIPAAGDTSSNTPFPRVPFEFQDDLYYFADNPDTESPVSWILWKGRSAAEAAPVKAVGFQYYDPVEPGYTVLGGRLYFSADDGIAGREPWSLPLE